MHRFPTLAALLLVPALAACGDSAPAKPAPGAPGALGGGPAKLGRKMPEFTPSGIADDFKKYQELDSAFRHSRTEDEKTKAEKELEAWKAEFPARWEGKDVPGPECLKFAAMLQACKKYSEAATQVRKYLAVAPDDSPNFVNATTLLIVALAQSGDYDGADRELKASRETVYKTQEGARKGVEETIAKCMYDNGRLDQAVVHFEHQATSDWGDIEAAILGVDCYLRLGKTSDAVDLARRAGDFIKEGKKSDRVKQLQQQVALVGRPAPDFSAAKWWKGTGGPVSTQQLKGAVTVVFAWNMQKQWNKWFFERINALAKDYAEKGVQVIGISRLAKFDAFRMCTDANMTDEKELEFYDAWAREYQVNFPLAVGANGDEALIDAWACHVVPTYIVVGKDGSVTYVRTGKDELYFASLREMIDKALQKP